MSSRMASIKKSTSIWGTKPSTAPTPARAPSQIRPMSTSLTPQPSRAARGISTSQAVPSTSLVQSVRKVPKGPMAIQYTANMTTAKMGRARIRLVTTRSILSEVLMLWAAAFFFTALLTTPLM